MDKNAGYILETIKDRIDIIKGYNIDTTSIESDYKQLEEKFYNKVSNRIINSNVAYMDTEMMSIEKTIDSFSTYLDNIIKGISIFETIDSAYEFKMTYCAGNNRIKSNSAFKKHVERVANGMLDYGDFYVLGIRKKNIDKYFEKLYELIKEEYREFGTTSILTAIEGSKMDTVYLTSLLEKQVIDLLKTEDKYKKEYLSANVIENGKINRELLAIVSLVEVGYDDNLIEKLVDLIDKMDSYKTKLENDKHKKFFDYIHVKSDKVDTVKKLISGMLTISVFASANAAVIKNRDNMFGGTIRNDYIIEDGECKYLGFEKTDPDDIKRGFDDEGILVEYSETRPDGTKTVKEYRISHPTGNIKKGNIDVTEKMLQSEKVISVEGTNLPDNKYYEYQEYKALPVEGWDYVVMAIMLLSINFLLSILSNINYVITGIDMHCNYDTLFPLLEDIYSSIITIGKAIEEMKEQEVKNKKTEEQIKELEARYKELTDRFNEARNLFSNPVIMANTVNNGSSLKMALQLAKRFNKEQLITFYYLLDEEKKTKVDKHFDMLLDNQRKILEEFKNKTPEEQKTLVDNYLKKKENKKTNIKEEKIEEVKEEIKDKKKAEKEVKDSKKDKAESIIKAIAGLSESIRLYSEFADKSMLDKLYHTVQIDEDTLFEKVDDHFVIRKEFVPVLKFLNLAFIDVTNLKVSDIDFRGTNIRINPQVVYNKDLSYSKFDDDNLFGDFTNCNLKGSDISKESLPVGINKSIIDKNTVLPKQEKTTKEQTKALE